MNAVDDDSPGAASVCDRLAFPRYCARAFPAYRYTPGRNPHPTAHPSGHSYVPPGAPVVHRRYIPPERWRDNEEYLYGCDLYNHAYWWEAHEAWEEVWRLAPADSAERSLLSGLIQVSACHLKLLLGHFDGVERLRAGGCAHLEAAEKLAGPAALMGLQVATFRREVEAYYSKVMRNDPGRRCHEPGTYPYLRLERF